MAYSQAAQPSTPSVPPDPEGRGPGAPPAPAAVHDKTDPPAAPGRAVFSVGSGKAVPSASPGPSEPPGPSGPPGKTILSPTDINRVVDRIAHQILEKTSGARDTVLLGIPTRGVPLARRLVTRIRAFEGVDVPVGSLDVTLYRDDLRLRAARPLRPTEVPPGGIDGRRVILVDDVLFSGRTVRAALDALSELGRPSSVQLAVLVDRGHRELPIRADYVGKNIPTALSESVKVLLAEVDGTDEVVLRPGSSGEGDPPGRGPDTAPDRSQGGEK